MQEIYAKEETFGISLSSTLEEDHEARQESRQAMNMTPNEPVGAKVSLIGFVLTTRASVQPLEDTFPVPLYSTPFLGLKFKI
jgi:hypothetical protein